MSLIRAFGEYWNADAVQRGTPERRRARELWGQAKVGKSGKKVRVNVYEQRGVYTLLSDFKVVYVGRVENTSLGGRLRTHTRDRFSGRWDMFSWYGVRVITARGKLRDFGARSVTQNEIIRTLESMAIAMTDAPLNRRWDRIPGAMKVEQDFEEGPGLEERVEEILHRMRDTETRSRVHGGKSKRGDRLRKAGARSGRQKRRKSARPSGGKRS